MTPTQKLERCPFCGSDKIEEIRADKPLPDFDTEKNAVWLYRCYGCRSMHYFYGHKGWNNRVGKEATP